MRLWPTSMPFIVLTGLLLLVVPLSLAMVLGIVYVDRISGQSERLVGQGIEVTRHSQRLKEHVTAMERLARQYQVLGDVSIIRLYEERHAQYVDVLNGLERFRLRGVADWNLEQLRLDSEQVLRAMLDLPPDSEDFIAVLDNFARMSGLASGISSEGNAFIDSQLAALQQTAGSAQDYLSWTIIAVLPATAVLIVLFTILFSRPFGKLSEAISELGQGRFEQPVHIQGPPAELVNLGEQLDWLRTQLQALDEEKALFLRHMSHELKTPLSSIRESTELLHGGMLGELSGQQQEVVTILRENGVELEHLIVNLLQLNVWQENPSEVDYQMVDFCALAREVLTHYQVTLDHKGIKAELQCAAVKLLADPLRLRMMINNLVSNAVKFSPPGGRIDIRARANKGRITIQVLDQGPGISEEDRLLIFKPFFQGQRPAGGFVRGTGIGLSVVQQCVDAHGGKVRVMPSQRGAHFHIELPAMPPQEESA